MLRSQSDIYSVPWDRRPSITAAFQLSSFPLLLREGRTGREGCIVEVLPQAGQVRAYINFEAEHNGVPTRSAKGREPGRACIVPLVVNSCEVASEWAAKLCPWWPCSAVV